MAELMNLEDDATPTVPEPVAPPASVATTPASAETPVAPAALSPDTDEDTAVEMPGGKFVPLEALKAARQEAKEAKQRAADVDALRQQNAALQGSLHTFQELRNQLARPAPAADASAARGVDPKLVEYARSLDYYKVDGTPDLERAAKHAQLVREDAQQLVQEALGPLRQAQARDFSGRNFQQAVQMTTATGIKPDPSKLAWMWQNLPAEYTADPGVAQVLPLLALGLQVMEGQSGAGLPPTPLPPNGPPVVTEAVGGGPRQRVNLSDVERAVIQHRGMSEERYQNAAKGFRPGRSSILED